MRQPLTTTISGNIVNENGLVYVTSLPRYTNYQMENPTQQDKGQVSKTSNTTCSTSATGTVPPCSMASSTDTNRPSCKRSRSADEGHMEFGHSESSRIPAPPIGPSYKIPFRQHELHDCDSSSTETNNETLLVQTKHQESAGIVLAATPLDSSPFDQDSAVLAASFLHGISLNSSFRRKLITSEHVPKTPTMLAAISTRGDELRTISS